MYKWISKNSTYYDRGAKAYCSGDEIPMLVIDQMGSETLKEYIGKGLILEETEQAAIENEREVLVEEAKALGIRVYHNSGIEKIKKSIDDKLALNALKKEALALGIDPSDDVDFATLKDLVDEKKNESDS